MNMSRGKEDLNVSVDDLRKSLSDVRRSEDMLLRAKQNLKKSREQYYLRKAEVLEGLHKTEEVRREMTDKKDDSKRTVKQIRQKKEQIEQYLLKRHAELKSQIDRQLSKSLQKLSERSEYEISEVIEYGQYLQKQILNFDMLKDSIRKKVQRNDDYDLDFEKIHERVKRLERIPSRLRSKPVSTLYVSSRDLPLYHTYVEGKGLEKIDNDDIPSESGSKGSFY